MSRLSVRALRVLTPASALASLVANAIALCSNSWLHSTELMPNPFYNGSGDREQLAKNTVSGLWKMCFNERELPLSLSLSPVPRSFLLSPGFQSEESRLRPFPEAPRATHAWPSLNPLRAPFPLRPLLAGFTFSRSEPGELFSLWARCSLGAVSYAP